MIQTETKEGEYSNIEILRFVEKVRNHGYGELTLKVIKGKVITIEALEVHKKK